MLIFVILVTLFGAVSGDRTIPPRQEEFKEWSFRFQRRYQQKEMTLRQSIYQQNARLVKQHNAQPHQTYIMELNSFADRNDTPESYWRDVPMDDDAEAEDRAERRLSDGGNKKVFRMGMNPASLMGDPHTLPRHWDWREHIEMPPPIDQGRCGSCWAFCAVAALEAHLAIANRGNMSFSVSHLVDCARDQEQMPLGCMGGHPVLAFRHVVSSGIPERSNHEYVPSQKECDKTCLPRASCGGYRRTPIGNETALAAIVARIGPVSVGIDGLLQTLRFYKSGIYFDEKCSNRIVNHCVLVVGYGEENGQEYWIIRNSWGPQWGENGYFRLARNAGNHCGIGVDGAYPIDVKMLP